MSNLCLLSSQNNAQLIRRLEGVMIPSHKQRVQITAIDSAQIDNATGNQTIERLTHNLHSFNESTAQNESILAFQVSRRYQCASSCFCSCHKRQLHRSPAMIDQILGSIFVGYLGMPVWYQKCDEKNCKSRSPSAARVTYCFPRWFWNRAVRIGMTFAPCGGPELLLRFPRLRPAGSKWFELVRLGDIGSMQTMLAKGEASG